MSLAASCTKWHCKAWWRGRYALLIQEGVTLQGSSAISKLPPYVTAQMVRFFYKVDTQQKAKILRKVSTKASCAYEGADRSMYTHLTVTCCEGNS